MNVNRTAKLSKGTLKYFENNLCGWAISKYLPYSGFKQLNQKKIGIFDVNLIS